MEAIATRFGITRERVRQICGRHGLDGVSLVDPIKVLKALEHSRTIGEMILETGYSGSVIERVLDALAPLAREEMAAYAMEAERTELIEKARELAAELGRTPTVKEFYRVRIWRQPVVRHFGSFTRLHRAAGLTPLRNAHPHMTEEQRAEVARRYVPPRGWAFDPGFFPGNAKELAREYGCTVNNINIIVRKYRDRAAA